MNLSVDSERTATDDHETMIDKSRSKASGY